MENKYLIITSFFIILNSTFNSVSFNNANSIAVNRNIINMLNNELKDKYQQSEVNAIANDSSPHYFHNYRLDPSYSYYY